MQMKKKTNQPSVNSLSSKLQTNRRWLNRGHLRTTTSDRSGGSMPVCPLLCSLRKLYSRQGLHTTKKAHKCTFSVRGGRFFSSSKPSPHRNSPHRNAVPEAKVLTGVAQWEGNQTIPFFYGLAGRQGGPLTFQPLICITPFQSGEKESSRTIYSSPSVIHGFVCCLLDASPWLLINAGNIWTVQIEILSDFFSGAVTFILNVQLIFNREKMVINVDSVGWILASDVDILHSNVSRSHCEVYFEHKKKYISQQKPIRHCSWRVCVFVFH